jgi:hypothetical protein
MRHINEIKTGNENYVVATSDVVNFIVLKDHHAA